MAVDRNSDIVLDSARLKNIRSRLKRIYDEDFNFELVADDGAMTAKLEIPLTVETNAVLLK